MCNISREEIERRRQTALKLDRQGLTITQIAASMGVTRRSVQRYRAALGIQRPVRRITDDDRQLIEDMLADECPIKEIARTLGFSADYLYQRYRGRSACRGGSLTSVRNLQRQLGLLLTDKTLS
jgi:AraC-like DNA-binding protein